MRLFVYGVLIDELASEPVRRLLAGLGPGRPASMAGQIVAVPDPLGWYPALLPGAGRVKGMLHEAGSVDLAALDRFEGIDPADPLAGDYRREEAAVESDRGEILTAFVYRWNRAVAPEMVPIGHGDFARWLREADAQPFAG